MRIALVGLAVAACGPFDQPPAECRNDADCLGDVCTRTHECLPASEVHSVMVRWRLDGQPASQSTCASHAIDRMDLTYGIYGGEDLTYSPVPCNAGQFFNDKWPTRFRYARVAAFDATNFPLGEGDASIEDPGPVDVTIELTVP